MCKFCPASTAQADCTKCWEHDEIYSDAADSNICKCHDGHYDSTLLHTCNSCDYRCTVCTGPLNTECTSCGIPLWVKFVPPTTCVNKTIAELVADCEGPDPTMSYYIPLLQCVERCGDGVDKGNLMCDDGNLVDGDGCSSECLIEDGFYCENGTLSNPDSCRPFNFITVTGEPNNRIKVSFDRSVFVAATNISVRIRTW